MLPFLAAPLALAVTYAAYWCNRNVWGFLPDDLPKPGRKQHARPIPLAGIALLPVLLLWLCTTGLWWLAVGTTLVAILGFLDDRSKDGSAELGWRKKAIGLAIGSVLATVQAIDPFAAPGTWLFVLCVVFVLTNATNFLDNTDGVAVALAGTGLLLAFGAGSPIAACGFAALGFLPYNWPRPHLFLGDAGAYALGLCSGYACAQITRDQTLWLGMAPFAVQFLDFVQVITARLWIGVSPFIGDRRHLTHIVQNLGLPRRFVAPLFVLAALLLFTLLRAA